MLNVRSHESLVKAKPIRQLSARERLNFLLTNRVPRRLLTQFIGWYSRVESVRLTRISIFIWSLFADDLKLQEAKKQSFKSLQDCFVRELKDGLRKIDNREHVVVSPCDAIVGACGKIKGDTLFQTKGFPYELNELIIDSTLAEKYRNGTYVTLRLKSSMYHRFHAPADCDIRELDYISGDTWNVNPVALKCIEKLYCKNERVVVELNVGKKDRSITLVPVAAILVASMKFNCLEQDLDLKYKGPNKIKCHAQYKKGDEMGYFQHGSTIIVFATGNYDICDSVKTGELIKIGQPLLIES
ncbi:archaetidylserine decarboxylase [Aliikangiella sp. IMCC44359]|uniref:archaetidylserine decarboxylase n=1 Tax=Aliikangiella sp. IMCC44359 TaxID=3459125 RepID=UPI00403B2EC7